MLTQKYYLSIVTLFFFFHFSIFAQEKSKEENQSCTHLQSCINIALELFDEKKYQEAGIHFQHGMEMAKKEDADKILPKLTYHYALNTKKLALYEEAIVLFEQFLEGKHNPHDTLLHDAYCELAKTHQCVGNHELSYEHQLKSLQLNQASGDSIRIMKNLYELGTIFFYQKNYQFALAKYKETETLAYRLASEKYQYNSIAAIGSVYGRLGESKSSMEYTMKAFRMANRINYKKGIAYAAYNIGSSYYSNQAFDSSLVYFQKAYDLNVEMNDIWGQTSGLEYLGNTYLELGDYEKGILYLNRSLELAEKIQSKPRILESYSALAEAHMDNKDYEEASKILTKYITLNDSLVNATMIENMSETKTKYEVQQKEIELAKKDLELNRTYGYFLLFAILFLSVMVWGIYRNYRIQKRNNQLLELKNQEVELNNQKLAANNEKLSRFAFIASHDLKEPLRTIGSYASLVKRRYKDSLDEDAGVFLDFITDGVSKMYSLLNDVLRYAKMDNDEDEPMEKVDMLQITNSAITNIQKQIQEKNATVEIGDLPMVMGREYQLVQVMQNLVSNGIKYNNEENPQVKISCKVEKERIVFSVKDNGIGFEMAYKDQIFEMFKRLHSKYEYSGSGVGLASCKKIVERYGGDIWVESALGEGSDFLFSIPKANGKVEMRSSQLAATA